MERSAEEVDVAKLNSLLRANGEQLGPAKLRRFACECCSRVSQLCEDPIYHRLLNFAFQQTSGPPQHDEFISLRSDAIRLYEQFYPGYGSPSAIVLALNAAGEAAFTESAGDAAINASSAAAAAMATSAAAIFDDGLYDEVYNAAHFKERLAQLNLLRQFDPLRD